MTLPTTGLELTYLGEYGYIALFLIIATSELTSVVPIGILLIAIGALARSGVFNFGLCLVIATAGGAVGDFLVFLLSRKFGKRESYRRFVQNNKYAHRIETYIRENPRATVFLSRLIGFISTPVNAIAGLSQMPKHTFLIFDILGVGLCALLYLGAGYLVGAAWQHDAHITAMAIGGILALIGVIYVAWKFIRRR